MKLYRGRCHCGAIRFEMRTEISSVIKCNCSICTKKGALFHKVKPEEFDLRSGGDNLTLYQFNTNVAKHLFCKTCGIYCFHHPRSTPELIAVNVNCLEEQLDYNFIDVIHFDGKTWDANDLNKIGMPR